MTATSAGVCFLVVAICLAGIGVFFLDLASSPPTWDWLFVAQLSVVLGIFGGGVAFLYLGLSLIEDMLPKERPMARPLRYLVVLALVLALAVAAIPLLPVAIGAMIILRMLGPALSWAMTRRCPGCVQIRSERSADSGPVFCPRHERFFGADMYRALVSNDGD